MDFVSNFSQRSAPALASSFQRTGANRKGVQIYRDSPSFSDSRFSERQIQHRDARRLGLRFLRNNPRESRTFPRPSQESMSSGVRRTRGSIYRPALDGRGRLIGSHDEGRLVRVRPRSSRDSVKSTAQSRAAAHYRVHTRDVRCACDGIAAPPRARRN